MTFTEFQEMCRKKHMNMVLWDMFHVEWKFACKHGYHNWQLMNIAEWFRTEGTDGPYIKITRNERCDKLIARCHCCGKEIEIYDDMA